VNDGIKIISYSFLAAALSVALLVLLCQEVVNRDMYKDSIQRFNTNLRLQELSGLIKLYDESLSMSSKMAVTTGDPQWEQRYRRFEPLLAAAIDEARELTWGTRADRGIAGTSVANGQLVDMEHSAFSLANRGDAQGARAILFSDEYRMQKRLYLAGLETLSTELPSRSGGSYDYPAKSIFAIVIALMALLGLTTVGLLRSNSQPTKRERNQDPENDFLKSVADDFSVMTVFYDQYGKVDSVNREFTSYLGYTAKEARQPNFRIRVCPDQGDFERLTRFVSAEEAGLLELP
jgi:PAS domain-containing protein